jgi:hypothetical protein
MSANVIFWVVNFKTQNYFVISTTQNVYFWNIRASNSLN